MNNLQRCTRFLLLTNHIKSSSIFFSRTHFLFSFFLFLYLQSIEDIRLLFADPWTLVPSAELRHTGELRSWRLPDEETEENACGCCRSLRGPGVGAW